MNDDLRSRSVRTLAWLGDAEFEREVRRRVAQRGDLPVDRLDAIKAEVVRAPTQALLLKAIEAALDEDERGVVRRARNAQTGSGGKRNSVKSYRAATALEALVAHWLCGPDPSPGPERFETLLVPPMEAAIEASLARHRTRPRRG